jgi:hypothetical protein
MVEVICSGLQACGNKLRALASGVLWFVKTSPEAESSGAERKA